MHWQFISPRLSGLELTDTHFPQTSIVLSDVEDYRDQLFPAEAAEVEPMAEVRQIEFATGRHCAHLAQANLGLDVMGIPRKDRVPVWPAHSVGSITHSSKVAAAMASTHFHSVGLDIEELGRVGENLHRLLFVEEEEAYIATSTFDAATVIFSAKEAGYKAIYPIAGKFIGFKEAQIHLDSSRQTFTIEYLGDHAAIRAVHSGQGYWQCHGDLVLTVFVIPRDI